MSWQASVLARMEEGQSIGRRRATCANVGPDDTNQVLGEGDDVAVHVMDPLPVSAVSVAEIPFARRPCSPPCQATQPFGVPPPTPRSSQSGTTLHHSHPGP